MFDTSEPRLFSCFCLANSVGAGLDGIDAGGNVESAVLRAINTRVQKLRSKHLLSQSNATWDLPSKIFRRCSMTVETKAHRGGGGHPSGHEMEPPKPCVAERASLQSERVAFPCSKPGAISQEPMAIVHNGPRFVWPPWMSQRNDCGVFLSWCPRVASQSGAMPNEVRPIHAAVGVILVELNCESQRPSLSTSSSGPVSLCSTWKNSAELKKICDMCGLAMGSLIPFRFNGLRLDDHAPR